MQKAKKQQSGKSSRKDRMTNRQVFAKPRFGQITSDTVEDTLVASYELATVSGTNGFNVTQNWPVFQDGSNFAATYRYFEVLGWKIDVTLPSLDSFTDSFYVGAVCIYPVSYQLDGINSVIPTDVRTILRQPGSVNCKVNTTNTGRWFPPPVKQVYSASSFVSGGTRLAFNIMAYFDNVGVNEFPAYVTVYCNVKFYSQVFQNSSVSFVKLHPSLSDRSTEIVAEKETEEPEKDRLLRDLSTYLITKGGPK